MKQLFGIVLCIVILFALFSLVNEATRGEAQARWVKSSANMEAYRRGYTDAIQSFLKNANFVDDTIELAPILADMNYRFKE